MPSAFDELACFALVGLFVLPACDSTGARQGPTVASQDPEATETLPDPGTIKVVRPLASTRFYPSAQDIETDLDQYFAQTAGHALQYTVSGKGTAASVFVSGERNHLLRIHPEQVGRMRVEIQATDDFENVMASSFEVIVLDPCPRQPTEEEANYFPIAVGEIWRFDFVKGNYTSFGSTRQIGELVWTIDSVSAYEEGRQRYLVQEEFVGKTQSYSFEVEDWVDGEERLWSTPFSIMIGDSVWLAPFFDRPVPRILSILSPDTVRFSNGLSGAYAKAYVIALVRDRGLVHRDLFYHFSASGYQRGEVSLVSKE